jgi:N-acyl-D-aspartate/D-glutamate deacylase
MMEKDGHAILNRPILNYADGDLTAIRNMVTHPHTLMGLGDGGAHYGAICDASYSTFLLTQFVKGDGPLKIGLSEAVHMLAQKAAHAVGLHDRGMLKVGGRADLNVIDLNNLTLHLPEVVRDLPAAGRRLHQRATGYDATIVAGEVIRRFDQSTGARPGKLVRGSAYSRAA